LAIAFPWQQKEARGFAESQAKSETFSEKEFGLPDK